jgi:hypothetical protein
MKGSGLLHFIAIFLIITFVILGLASTSTAQPMTRLVDNEFRARGESIDGFRFMVSTDVTLTLVQRDVTADRGATVVRETVVRNIINLNSNTRGRLRSGDVNAGLNVYFERDPSGGENHPTLRFVEHRESGRFHFHYVDDPILKTAVLYNGELYNVTWKGNEVPYLLYERIQRERTTTRRMSGVN